ncbi:MAG TPA: hypothetical protein VH089_13725 [Streptosporangiaceae bacterium]|nr:hypothetical protein [Streptosporangiaceae bacterium]
MALAADEERALSRIEEELRRCDPKLAAKLAMFNRLTQSEAMPQRELLTAPSRLRRLFASAGIRAARWRLYPPVPPRGPGLTSSPGPATRPGRGAQPEPGHLFSLSPRPRGQARPGSQTSEHPGPAPRRWPARLVAMLPVIVTVCAMGAIVAIFSALSRVDTSAANQVPARQCQSVLLAGCQSATAHTAHTAPNR